MPWLLIAPGAPFIRKSFENDPFIRRVYLPNAFLVGPEHVLERKAEQWVASDPGRYEDREISDEECVAAFAARA